MRRIKRRLKRINTPIKYTFLAIILFYLLTYIFFTKSLLQLTGIETVLRIIAIIFFLLWLLIYIFINLIKLVQKKHKFFIVSSVISLIFILVFCFGSYLINPLINSLDNLKEKDQVTYTSYLVTLKDYEFDEDSVIGKISDEEDVEGFILANKLIEKEGLTNKISNYGDYLEMVVDLYEKDIDAILMPSNYVAIYENMEGYENIATETVIVHEYSELMENQDVTITSSKDFSEPLTFLIMGVDSESNGLNANAAFNGDTLMVASINPKTLDVILLSIPRDTYVPISCNNNKYSKINSAAAYGTNCVISTVSNLLEIEIDYFAKINFKGVVELVDALGGVEVDVQKPDYNSYNGQNYGGKMCEQNSDRQFGDKLVCVEPGLQVLNGEEALAYARNRHLYIRGDLDRVVHQQQIVEAIAKKLLNFSTLTDFQEILTAISNNISTNMETKQILSGYQVMKNMASKALAGEEFINMNKAYLETYSLPVYLTSGYYTSAQAYYDDSLEDIKKEFKIVLGLEKREAIKTFSFSVNEEYIQTSSGEGLRKEQSLYLMKNLIGSSVDTAEEYCNTYGINLEIEYVDYGDAHYNADVAPGLIGDQSVAIGTLLNNVKTLTIYISNAKTENEPPSTEKPDDVEDENKNDEEETPTEEEKENNEEIDDVVEDLVN